MSAPIPKKFSLFVWLANLFSLRSPKPSSKTVFLLLSLLTVLISSAIAFSQNPYPDAYKARALFSKEWFQYPVETNAFLRLPVISGVNDSFILPDGEHIWMVGKSGLILYSDNGGLSWQRQTISPQQDSKSSESSWSFIKTANAAEPIKKVNKKAPDNKLWQEYIQSRPVEPNKNVKQENATQDVSNQSTANDEALWRQFLEKKSADELQAELDKSKNAQIETFPVNKKDVIQTKTTTITDADGDIDVRTEITARQPKTKSSEVFDASKANLTAVYFINRIQGWAVGENGMLITTRDGGQSWHAQASGTRERLKSIQMLGDGQRGWAVGSYGAVITTRDGGQSWQVQASGTREWLESIQMLGDGQRGWAVGNYGTVITTRDGGQSWQEQASGTRASLNAIQMLGDGQRGWAVGRSGTVLTTRDGGQSWQEQASGTREWLESIQMLGDGQRGWAVGRSGTVLTTRDGGQSWQEQASGTRGWLNAIQMLGDGQRGWAVGRSGTVLTTRDGGQSWQVQASGTRGWLTAIQMLGDGQRGWAVGRSGTVLTTRDGGQSWQVQASGTQGWLNAIQMLGDGQRGWAVGDRGTVLTTRDGGQSWQVQASGTWGWLKSIQMLGDGQRGWAVGERGTVLTTRDGGQNWQKQASGALGSLSAIQMQDDGQRGWAVGERGTVLTTRDGGQNWQKQASGTLGSLSAIQMLGDGQRGWAVGRSGTVLATRDGGQSWQGQASGTRGWLNAIQMLGDGQRGWAVGERGTVLTTRDGGQNWQKQASGTLGSLSAIQMQDDGQRGWAVGSIGTVLTTRDGGQGWHNSLSNYARYPAPWYYLSWLLAVGFLLPVFKQQDNKEYLDGKHAVKSELHTNASSKNIAPVENILVSDRPLEYGENDALGFKAIARGISKFIRNENTTPPLTLAITGAWGSGKSSLMNLLKSDLKHFGFRPVWFNAWHYQKEEHLLAALLTSIYAQGIPPWWCYDGVLFRLRLLIRRGWRHWFPLVALLGVIVFSVSFMSHQNGSFKQRVDNLEHAFTESVIAKIPVWNSGDKTNAEAENKNKVLNNDTAIEKTSDYPWAESSFIGAFIGLLITLFKGFKAFGISPVRLMSSMSGRFKPNDLNQQLSFRHQFAREFRDVTYALSDRAMVIMVDDLDRCRPDSVLEVLEAVNFLVTSGDCYIVLAMDLKRVISCVGLGFKDLAEASDDGEQTNKPKTENISDEIHNQSAFANNYLEKLINIEIPVPDIKDNQVENLMKNKNNVKDDKPKALPETLYREVEKLSALLRKKSYKLSVIAIVVSVLAFSGWYGMSYDAPLNVSKGNSEITNPLPNAEKIENTAKVVQHEKNDQSAESVEPKNSSFDREVDFRQGQEASMPLYLSAPPMIALLLVAIWLSLFRRPDPVVRDTEEFKDALRVWQSMIVLKQRTPRSIKRFMNRVRYFSMRHHSMFEKKKYGWLKNWLSSKSESFRFLTDESVASDVECYIREDMLVALTAIHHGCPELLENNKIIDIKNDVLKVFYDEGAEGSKQKISKEEEILKSCIEEHCAEFKSYMLDDDQLKQFDKLSKGIVVS